VWVAAAGGCGYALAGRGSFLPASIEKIGIPEFTNRTTIFNLETMVTQKVRAEFIGRGRYQILPEAQNVDALLTGEIGSVSVSPVSFSGDQLASRYTITMAARVELRDMRDNTVLWENGNLIFRQEYDAQSGPDVQDAARFFEQDVSALDRITTDFARTIVSSILEAF
jgi:hypothetical protein